MTKWFDVKERLPKHNHYVLAYVIDSYEGIRILNYENKRFYIDLDYDSEDITEDVTHWMELPEPPK